MCMYHMHCACVLRQASHEYQMYACTGEVVLTIMMSRQLLKLTGFYFACFKSCVPFLLVYKQVSAHKVFCNMGSLVSPQPVLNFLLCESGHIFIPYKKNLRGRQEKEAAHSSSFFIHGSSTIME